MQVESTENSPAAFPGSRFFTLAMSSWYRRRMRYADAESAASWGARPAKGGMADGLRDLSHRVRHPDHWPGHRCPLAPCASEMDRGGRDLPGGHRHRPRRDQDEREGPLVEGIART